MTREAFFVADLLDLKPLRNSALKIPSPLGYILTRFCDSSTPGDARTAIEDFFKISTQLTLLIFVCLIRQLGAELPRQLRTTVREKWLQGTHDLTEGERLSVIKGILREMRSTLAGCKIGSEFLQAYADESYDDLDALIIFKKQESHLQSGGDEWSRKVIAEALASFESLVRRWDRLSHLEFLLVRSGVGLVLAGPGNPERRNPGQIPSGLYLWEPTSGERVSLEPLIEVADDFSVRVFCGANGRKPTASRFASLGLEAAESEGTMDALEVLGSLLPKDEQRPLFGMEKNLQKISALLKDWANGKGKASLLFVTGEEGTGKSSLIARAVGAMQPQPLRIPISGDSGHGELKSFCLEVLSGLFVIDPAYDAHIVDRLKQFGIESGASLAAETLEGFLTGHTDIQIKASAHVNHVNAYDEQDDKWRESRLFEDSAEHGRDLLANRIHSALVRFIRAWAFRNDRKVIIWIQDAQLYEKQPDIALDVFIHFQRKQPATDVLVIAEFRAERTRDAKRIRERYLTSSGPSIETQELDKEGVHKLVAWRLSTSPDLLSVQVGDEIYKSSGGNPKWVLDVLTILEGRGEIKSGQSPTELSLRLPKLVREAIPGELKDITKSRILSLNWTRFNLDVLTVLSLSSSRAVPVSFVAKVLGDECQQAIGLFEQLDLIKADDTYEEWHVTFEHLAARQASKEIAEGRDKADLNDLAERALVALELESTVESPADLGRLFPLIKGLAELTSNPEALGLTVAPLLSEAKIDDLRGWSSILKKTLLPTPFLTTVRDYAALRLAELEARDLGSDFYERIVSRKSQPAEQIDSVKAQLFVELVASSLAALTRMFPDRHATTTVAVLNFLKQLASSRNSHVSQEELVGCFAIAFWKEIGAKTKPSSVMDLWRSVKGKLDSLNLPPILHLVFIALGTLHLLRNDRPTRDGLFPESDFADALSIIDLSVTDLSQSTPSAQVARDRVSAVINLIRAHLRYWIVIADPSLLDIYQEQLYSLLHRLEELGDKRAAEVRCELSGRIAVGLSDSKELAASSSYWTFLDDLKRWPLARLIALATSLVHRRKKGLPYEDLATAFVGALETSISPFELSKNSLKSITMAISVIGTESAFARGRTLFREWIENRVKEEEFLNSILELIRDIAPTLLMDPKEQFDLLLNLKRWKKEETSLINLYRSESIRLKEKAGDKSKWEERFDEAKEEFIATSNGKGSSQKRPLLETAFRNMASELLNRASIRKPENIERLRQFLQILDHWIPSDNRDLDHVASYWGIRWHVLSLLKKRDIAICECSDMLNSCDDSGRQILVPRLAKLLGPSTFADTDTDSLTEPVIETDGPVVSEELISLVLEWHKGQPNSPSCGVLMLRIASFTSGEEAHGWLARAEGIADRLLDHGRFDQAASLYDLLLTGYYREHEAEKAGEMKEHLLICAKRQFPNVTNEVLQDIRNNGNYVQLGISLRRNSIGQDLLSEMKSVIDSSQISAAPNALHAYNYCVALAYAGQIEEALITLKHLLQAEEYKTDLRSNETRWVFLFTAQRLDGTLPEVEHVQVITASLLSACNMLIALDRRSEARMWAVALLKRLKSEQEKIRDERLFVHVLDVFIALSAKPNQWLAGKLRRDFPRLLMVMEEASCFDELIDPKKDQPCPCGSTKAYRDCCSDLLRQ